MDDDAAYLHVATQVHAVNGFPATCRVAVRIEGVYRVCVAHHDVGGTSTAVPCTQAS